MGECVDKPSPRDRLHPDAHERDKLAGEKQSIVPMPEYPDQLGRARRVHQFENFRIGLRCHAGR